MSRNVCAECGALISMSEVWGLCCSADPTHFGMLQPREMEMSAAVIAQEVIADCYGASSPILAGRIEAEIVLSDMRGYQRGKAEQSVPCEWEDLKHLEGRELRERLRCRAAMFANMAKCLQRQRDLCRYNADMIDIQILIDLIQSKSQACEVEADRLWSVYLESFEPLLDEPDGAAKIVAALGREYLPVIVDRAAAKRAREAAIYKEPTNEECEECQGSGVQNDNPFYACSCCNGKGRVRSVTTLRVNDDGILVPLQEVS